MDAAASREVFESIRRIAANRSDSALWGVVTAINGDELDVNVMGTTVAALRCCPAGIGETVAVQSIGQSIAATSVVGPSAYSEDLDNRVVAIETDYVKASAIDDEIAYVGALVAGNVTAQNIISDHGVVGSISTNYAHIKDGVIDNATIGHASINGLDANYAEIDLANVSNAWIENGVIKDAAISDAQIIGVSANKLTAGTIDASKIYVTNLNADNITVGTINGKRIGNASIDLSKLAEEVPTKEYLESVQQSLQGQIDGQIETWTSSDVPLLSNYPASSWTDQKTRKAHVGDVLYVVNAASDADGYCYRFSEDSSGAFSWVLIKDSDVTKALKELIDIQGDVHGLQSFQSETSSWIANTDEELSSIKTNQTSLETSLGKKVETSVFNELSQTVGENSASITSLANTVETKADNSTVTSLTNTVNSVKQTADSNTASISNLTTTVNDYGSRLTNAETSITQNTNQISLRATKTEAQTYAANAVSDLQVGGRNMLRNTDTFSDWIINNSSYGLGGGTVVDNKWNGNAAVATEGAWLGPSVGFDKVFPKYSIRTGDTLTLSQWIMFDFAPVKDFHLSVYRSGEDDTSTGVISAECTIPYWAKTGSANNILIHKDYVEPNVWYRIAFTFPAPSTLNKRCRIENNYYTTSDYKFGTNGEKMYIAGCKFERGNKSTDWTPAEEDIDTRISSAETAIEQNTDEINLRATKTEAQGYANQALADAKSYTTSQGYLTVNSDKITAMVSATTAAKNTADDALDLAGTKITESAAIEIAKNQIESIVISSDGGTTVTQTPDSFIWTISSPTVPTKVSQLTNDSKFTTMSAVEGKGYQTASQVSTAANNAAKTATNFMKFSSSEGLTIGNNTSGSMSGYRTVIKNDGMDVVDESGVSLAHYGSEAVIGKDDWQKVRISGEKVVVGNALELNGGVPDTDREIGTIGVYSSDGNAELQFTSSYDAGSVININADHVQLNGGRVTPSSVVVNGVTWKYRKIGSVTEAWATVTRTITSGMTDDGAWGYYVKADAVNYPTNLFSSAPKVMISARGPFGYPMLVGNGTAAKTPDMYFYRPTNADAFTVYFDLYVIGE